MRDSFRRLLLPLVVALAVPSMARATFLENRGQVEPAVLYYSVASRGSIRFASDEITVGVSSIDAAATPARLDAGTVLRGDDHVLRIRFGNGARAGRVEGRDPLPGKHHLMLGKDPQRWHLGIASFQEVVYRELWPGIDVSFRWEPDGLSYRVHTAPGARVEDVRFSHEAVGPVGGGTWSAGEFFHLTFDEHTRSGRMRWSSAPCPTAGCPEQPTEPSRPELLEWSTLAGDAIEEAAHEIARDPAGNLLIAGSAYGSAFVKKISGDGTTLLWSTFLGDTCQETAYDIAIDASGNPVIVGYTVSEFFPTTPGAFRETRTCPCQGPCCASCMHVFVSKLSSSGDSLIWSTFLGPTGDHTVGIRLDAFDRPVVVGNARSADFPVGPDGFDPSHNGGTDGFVCILSADGDSLLHGTFLGGSDDDEAWELSADEAGNLWVTGFTRSTDFPAAKGYRGALNNSRDAFAAKLDPLLTELQFGVVLGGSEDDTGQNIFCGDGRVFLCGTTASSDFPASQGVIDRTYNGGDRDAFVACLNDDIPGVCWSTFFGGIGDDVATDVAFDARGAVIIRGFTESPDLPTTSNAYDRTFNGAFSNCSDVFLAALSPAADQLVMATFFGGSHVERWSGMLVEDGCAIITGATESCDFPLTPGACDSLIIGNAADAFVSKLRLDFPPASLGAGGSPSHPLMKAAVLPNPVSSGGIFHFTIERSASVRIEIRDLAGRIVWSSADSWYPEGRVAIVWDGRDRDRMPCRPGVYFFAIRAGDRAGYGKLTLMR